METELEKVLMNSYKTDMILYLANNPNGFKEAIHLALADKQPYSWRAAWLLWSCMEENDTRIKPHIRSFIECMGKKSDGHQREFLKILHLMDIDEKFEGILFDHCISIWEKINKQPSVRFNAFKIILKTCRKHPELSNEINFLMQDHYTDTLSRGVRHSINKMINEMEVNYNSPME